jgi:hypothetical protein
MTDNRGYLLRIIARATRNYFTLLQSAIHIYTIHTINMICNNILLLLIQIDSHIDFAILCAIFNEGCFHNNTRYLSPMTHSKLRSDICNFPKIYKTKTITDLQFEIIWETCNLAILRGLNQKDDYRSDLGLLNAYGKQVQIWGGMGPERELPARSYFCKLRQCFKESGKRPARLMLGSWRLMSLVSFWFQQETTARLQIMAIDVVSTITALDTWSLAFTRPHWI